MRELNDNENFSMKRFNDNVNEEKFVVGTKPREQRAYGVALKLVEKFSNPQGLRFYYNVALKFSEDDIWKKCERANKKGITYPGKYFTTICNNDLNRLQKAH